MGDADAEATCNKLQLGNWPPECDESCTLDLKAIKMRIDVAIDYASNSFVADIFG